MSETGFENNLTNASSFNESGVDEFPLWQPLVAVNILLFVGLLVPVTLFVNLSVFAALIKTDTTNKLLIVLSGSLLIGLCIDKLLVCVDQIVNSPIIIRYCICMNLSLSILSTPRAFFIVYSVVTVTCQSVLQLLVLMGKSKWRKSYKRNLACVFLSAVVALFWTLLFFVSNLLSESPLHCQSFCTTPDNTTSSDQFDFQLLVVGGYALFTLAPAFVTAIVTSVWALVLFKRKITLRSDSKDSGLNRKLILLPLLMVFLLTCNSLMSYLLTDVTGAILKGANLDPFFGNWANYVSDVEYFILDLLHGLSYPLILVYLNSALRATWKRMFHKISSRKSSTIQIIQKDSTPSFKEQSLHA